MRLGLLLPTRLGVSEQKSVQEILELAGIAEKAGVHSLWVGDSLFARPRLDPLATLCAVAATTTGCMLGTAVLVAPMWNPLLLARMVATLDQLAHGRLVLGFGPGRVTARPGKSSPPWAFPSTGGSAAPLKYSRSAVLSGRRGNPPSPGPERVAVA